MEQKSIIKTYFSQLLLLRVYLIKNTKLGKLYLKRNASKAFQRRFNRKLNWKNPKDLNEKIQWLKFNSDITLWTRCADKYAVRDYVKECGLEHILVKLYGVWDNPEDINFDSLPEKFVLKTNNSSGTNIIINDKATIRQCEIKNTLRIWLKESNQKLSLELQYFDIKPKIIAEEFLPSDNQDIPSFSLVDYKVWCLNGEPYSIWTCYNRDKYSTYVALYDMEWNYHPEHSIFTNHYRKGELEIPKPVVFDEMIDAAKKLSKNIPQVRIDFYIVDNKLFFGEMTFTSLGGSMNYYTQEYLTEMGQILELPTKSSRKL